MADATIWQLVIIREAAFPSRHGMTEVAVAGCGNASVAVHTPLHDSRYATQAMWQLRNPTEKGLLGNRLFFSF